MGKLRSLYKDSEVLSAIEQATDEHGNVNYNEMARILSAHPVGKKITRQLARYWHGQFKTKKKNGDAYQSLLPENKRIKEARSCALLIVMKIWLLHQCLSRLIEAYW
ncbi:phosphoesterase [Klebsiella phage IME184]|uniref:Phosphoesterase n=1 Tax=Klebsiella phage IME184 TaxID=2860373 RepID=A0AC61NAF6_9CAUD|nr:phosphoesterase [Klebsiella phage IME184]